MPTARVVAGAVVHDLPRLAAALRPGWLSPGRPSWVGMRNRAERLQSSPDGKGVRCDWAFASELHVARVFPLAGRLLLRRALADWPVEFADAPPARTGVPEVSFVIGHRGIERLPLLLATLRSLAAQRGPVVECVVVEQSVRPLIDRALPGWVRYRHAAIPDDEAPFSRSQAMNSGAIEARGKVLVLHDGDILAPAGYAGELLRLHGAGQEAINLKRLVFSLSDADTRRVVAQGRLGGDETPEAVVQNLEGGGSVAIGRESFSAIGGMDERFTGWGGEDNEFWERCALVRRWEYASLPFVHLWHPPQPEKQQAGVGAGQLRYRRLAGVAPADRVKDLLARRGDLRATRCVEGG